MLGTQREGINKDVYYISISLLSTTARRGNPSLMTRWENRKATMVRNRHKKVTCGKCLRIMRSDYLKTHMKQHEKVKFEKEVYSSASIRSSRISLQEETESDFSSISTYTSTPINEEFTMKRLKMNNYEYDKKMEIGKIIAKAIKDGEIAQDSLCSEDREALDLFWNKKQLLDIKNIVLKTWQSALIAYMKPKVREVIWVQGEKCNEGKSYFQEYIEAKFG